jgi:ribosome biogenesis protein ERB1
VSLLLYMYSDLLRNALIVPVKVLKGHEVSKFGELGVMDCEFHPTQPWLISCGADGTARLFT